MTEQEIRFQAAINELRFQREEAQARCANLAGDLAAAYAMINAKNAELEHVKLPDKERKQADLRAAIPAGAISEARGTSPPQLSTSRRKN